MAVRARSGSMVSTQLPAKFGKYELLELVARGGMAEIYRARTVGLGGFEKYCAIKKILPHLNENQEFITMLIDEAKIVVSLQHANIVQVMDLGKIDGSYYIAMDYVHGMDLATILKTCAYNNFIIPFEYTIHIGMQVCAGLYAAHSKPDEHGNSLGIIHRDISPHNILISYDGEVKIIDFGVAKASIKMTHTMSGIIKGKLLYMAPEQAMAKEIDQRADLFSVGLVLYKMTTHQLPFEGENEFQIYNKLVQGKILPPRKLNPKVPEALEEVILKSLRKRPEGRYQDAFEFRNALGSVLAEVAPGFSPSRLAQFMETYFPPRALVNPEPEAAPQIAPLGISSDDASQDPTYGAQYDAHYPGQYDRQSDGRYDELVSSTPPEPGYAPPPPNGLRSGNGVQPQPAASYPPPPPQPPPPPAGRGAPPSRPPAAPAVLDQGRGGPYGPAQRGGPRQASLLPSPAALLSQNERTVQVGVPYGMSLLGQETMPASAALFGGDSFPDAPADPLQSGGGPALPRVPRFGTALKVVAGVALFCALLAGGIFGGYALLELFSPTGPTVSPAPELGEQPGQLTITRTGPDEAGGSAGSGRAGQGAGSGSSGAESGSAAAPEQPDAVAGGGPPGELAGAVDSEGQLTLKLESLPTGAQVYQGGVYIGQTDMVLKKRKKAQASIRFTFRKDGYLVDTRTVSLDKDQTLLVRLRPGLR